MKSVRRLPAILVVALLPVSVWAWQSATRTDTARVRITRPVLFNTPEADRILANLQIFPPDNAWNRDISRAPLLPNSAAILETIGKDKSFAYNLDMNFVLVPPNQPRIPVRLTEYTHESDPGPYPVPDNLPIEGWPLLKTGSPPSPAESLDDIQRNGTGDRHAIVVDPARKMLYEFYNTRKTASGWQAEQASVWSLKSNRLRPAGWTSSDAAGLPIFPAIVRFDECERGMVRHAMRFTVRKTARAYVTPATHFASRRTEPNLPRMGERFRLRADYPLSDFPPHARAILKGLQTYGMFVADNGGDWRLSVAPDSRLQGLESLKRLRGSDFEVVDAGRPATAK